jgi:hypothetical protein
MTGALAGSRAPNLLIRSQVLYPIKLRAREKNYTTRPIQRPFKKNARELPLPQNKNER